MKSKKLLAVSVAATVMLSNVMNVSAAALKDLFDPGFYMSTYSDVREKVGDDENALYNHFMEHGIGEARKLSPYFDIKAYRAQNADLEEAFGDNWAAYYEHYLTCGVREGRNPFTDEFNYKEYAERYPDLKEAFGYDAVALYRHYLTIGIKEGRNAASTTPEPIMEPIWEPEIEESTSEPTTKPTAEPTQEPTTKPTAEPTQEPTTKPTAEPTQEPTTKPTAEPTSEPTTKPTAEPTQEPTTKPTAEPIPVQQRETDHFVFWCSDQDVSVLDDLEDALEGCYSKVTTDLGKAPSEKTKVYISPNLEAHHNAIGRPDAPDWSVGNAMNGVFYMVSPLNPGPAHTYDEMIVIAVHEYVHIIVWQFKQQQNKYLNEGLACYESGQGDNNCIKTDKKNGTPLPTLSELLVSQDFVDNPNRAYGYSYVYIDFIAKTYGFDKVIPLLEGKTHAEAFGVNQDEIEKAWMDFLEAYPE